jgi:hypothetical protein
MTKCATRHSALAGTASACRARALFSLSLLAGLAFAASGTTSAADALPTSVTGSPSGDAFNMSEVSTTVAETGGSVTLTVLRQGVGAGAASVDYSTVDFTAHAPEDYATTSGTLTWADGDLTPQTVTIPIIDDAIHQGDLEFGFVLSNPQGGSTGVLPSEAVTIIDDESGAVAQAIPAPTLGTFGHALLGGLLALVAFVAMRRRGFR